MKLNIKKLVVGSIIAGALISSISIFAAPGDGSDPIISLSYLNEKLKPEMETYIDGKIQDLEEKDADKFVVVSVKKGETFYGKEGTEFILRMGGGTVIASKKGGIANVTTGVDLQNGMDLPSNSLLIVPLDDGRGFKATDEVLVMVKGKYDIK